MTRRSVTAYFSLAALIICWSFFTLDKPAKPTQDIASRKGSYSDTPRQSCDEKMSGCPMEAGDETVIYWWKKKVTPGSSIDVVRLFRRILIPGLEGCDRLSTSKEVVVCRVSGFSLDSSSFSVLFDFRASVVHGWPCALRITFAFSSRKRRAN